MDDIRLIIEKEFRDYCNGMLCEECKYCPHDISCEICYITDNFYLVRKDDSDEN